jgi:hypothetical protein
MTTYDYGLKVTKAGASISSSDLRDIIFSSKYSMLKQHSTSTGSATISQGGTSCYVDFTHNLGYVPVFLAYVSVSGFEDSKDRMIPNYSWGSIVGSEEYNFFGVSTAYANSSTIRCTYNLSIPYNTLTYDADGVLWELETEGAALVVGNAGDGKSSGWHFSDVLIAKDAALTTAQLEIKNVFSGPTNADTKYRIYGIDEDNVGDINDFGKTKTTAYDARNQSKVSGWFNFGTDCKDQVAEIISRSGWASGNNMGFYLNDDGSNSDAYIGTATSGVAGVLTIVKTGSITVTFRVIIFKDKII